MSDFILWCLTLYCDVWLHFVVPDFMLWYLTWCCGIWFDVLPDFVLWCVPQDHFKDIQCLDFMLWWQTPCYDLPDFLLCFIPHEHSSDILCLDFYVVVTVFLFYSNTQKTFLSLASCCAVVQQIIKKTFCALTSCCGVWHHVFIP